MAISSYRRTRQFPLPSSWLPGAVDEVVPTRRSDGRNAHDEKTTDSSTIWEEAGE